MDYCKYTATVLCTFVGFTTSTSVRTEPQATSAAPEEKKIEVHQAKAKNVNQCSCMSKEECKTFESHLSLNASVVFVCVSICILLFDFICLNCFSQSVDCI